MKENKNNWQDETIIVPKNHVWLEGDNPLFSIDSRHIGPIPINWIRGKVITRIWPLQGGEETEGWKSNRDKRPIPHEHMEDYLGSDKGYNLYRVEKRKQ